MKQTAVEWIENNIQSDMTFMDILGLIRQAKEMEKEQIKDSYKKGFAYRDTWNWELNVDWNEDLKEDNENEFEQYYKETFKSENVVMFMNTENSGIESIKLTDNPDCGIKGITFKSE
jgi:hypothetical protein